RPAVEAGVADGGEDAGADDGGDAEGGEVDDAERPPQVRLGAGVDLALDAEAGLGVLLDERDGFLAEERRRVHGHLAGFGSRSFSQAAPARSAARSAG